MGYASCTCCLLLLAAIYGGQAHYSVQSDAFHDVLHFLYGPFSDTTGATLTAEVLRPMYDELFEKVECAEKVDNCTECVSDLVEVTRDVNSSVTFNEMSLIVLYAVLDVEAFCNMTITEKMEYNATSALVSLISADNPGVVGEEEIEKLMEALGGSFSGEEHHEEEEDHGEEEEHHDEEEDHSTTEHSDDVTTTESGHPSTEHEEGEEEEEHHESPRCFGEGTLLYYMGLDHEDTVSLDRVPEMAGILVSYLLQDWVVSEECQVLPKQADIIGDVFNSLGDGETISEEGFEEMLEALEIGAIAGAPATAAPADDGHGHKRSIRRRKRSLESEPSITSQCMSEATLSSVYDLDLEDGITREKFVQLCPALIQQQLSHSCEAESPTATTSGPEESAITAAQTYGYGTLAVVIISLLALLGVLLIPCINAQIIKYMLNMFVAMGVGTMVSDALLHLMPQALGLHAHGAGEGHAEEGVAIADNTLVQLGVCAAIYGFYLFEYLMATLRPKNRSSHGHGHSHMAWEKTSKVGDKFAESRKRRDSLSASEQTGSSCCADKAESTEDMLKTPKKRIPTVALMILLGDGIHNFIDGIAIGAAFSVSLQDGLGTSIAVFCHELPHELGDFSILLQTGMSKCRAIMFNLLSASMCLVGLYIGAAVGADHEARKWLLALTAGMFIYIALVDMLPELMQPQKEGKWWIYFIVQNVGMLLGIGIMLIIAVFEEVLIHMD